MCLGDILHVLAEFRYVLPLVPGAFYTDCLQQHVSTILKRKVPIHALLNCTQNRPADKPARRISRTIRQLDRTLTLSSASSAAIGPSPRRHIPAQDQNKPTLTRATFQLQLRLVNTIS